MGHYGLALGALIIASISASSMAAEVKVLSAVGMRQVMFELAPKFERATGHTLKTTFDATGLLAKRIAAGEQVDVAMLNQSAMEALERDRHLLAGSVKPIARSVAAVAVRKGEPKPDISSPEAFKRLLLSAKSISRPSPAVGGSSGDHIVKVIERLGIAAEVDAKTVIATVGQPGQAGMSPGEAVANGRAEVALHQLQELLAVPGIDIVGEFPGELQGSFVFSAAIGASAREPEAGKALIAFLRTPEASGVIRAKGMAPESAR